MYIVGKLAASGRERTRREILTICKSFEPVGEEILRGRDLKKTNHFITTDT